MAIGRAPMRSVSRPAQPRVSSMPRPCGASSRPATSALWPRTCCSYRGSSSIAPYTDKPDRNSRLFEAENERTRNSRRSRSGGRSVRSAWRTKPPSSSAPTASGSRTAELSNPPWLPAWVSP